MCQPRGAVAGGLIQDLDNCSVMAVDCEDRRYCFQITTPNGKSYATRVLLGRRARVVTPPLPGASWRVPPCQPSMGETPSGARWSLGRLFYALFKQAHSTPVGSSLPRVRSPSAALSAALEETRPLCLCVGGSHRRVVCQQRSVEKAVATPACSQTSSVYCAGAEGGQTCLGSLLFRLKLETNWAVCSATALPVGTCCPHRPPCASGAQKRSLGVIHRSHCNGVPSGAGASN